MKKKSREELLSGRRQDSRGRNLWPDMDGKHGFQQAEPGQPGREGGLRAAFEALGDDERLRQPGYMRRMGGMAGSGWEERTPDLQSDSDAGQPVPQASLEEWRQASGGTWYPARERRSPRVLYDSAMNRVEALGDANPWGYYDAETEQYIDDLTQKRSNPRYEFISPEEADEKQKAWNKSNERWFKSMPFLYGARDELKKNEIGRGQKYSYGLTDDALRQKREDDIIGQASVLEFQQPDSPLGGIIQEFGASPVRNSDGLGKELLEEGLMDYLFLQERLRLEKKPLDFYKKSKKIRKIMENEGLSLADAIIKGNREAVEEFMEDLLQSKKDNSFYENVNNALEDGSRAKDVYGVEKALLIDGQARRRARERLERYFEE